MKQNKINHVRLGDIVSVWWTDSVIDGLSEYTLEDKDLGICEICSVGYLVKLTAEFVAVAREKLQDGDSVTYRGVVIIIRNAIIRLKKLTQ